MCVDAEEEIFIDPADSYPKIIWIPDTSGDTVGKFVNSLTMTDIGYNYCANIFYNHYDRLWLYNIGMDWRHYTSGVIAPSDAPEHPVWDSESDQWVDFYSRLPVRDQFIPVKEE